MKTLTVDFNNIGGKIKPMNAVNNGPAGSKVRATSGFGAYKAARIPFARNHDASFSTYYGGEHTVDVHRIFKNFDADENDPASYVFEPTDNAIADLIEVGTKPFYRLGASIEHGYKYGTYPPKDYLKWARICEHIIRHYNEGWAEGFHYNIEYWEIWNEPDVRNPDGSNPCWQGTSEEFAEFFAVAVKHLKEKFPELKIGGPAMASIRHEDNNYDHLHKIKECGLHPDFLSFHCYGKTVERFTQCIDMARAAADEYFGKDAEIILNEWNYIRGWLADDWTYSLKMEKGLKGASFINAVMSVGQDSPLDMLMYYDARPCGMNGMFDTDTLKPLKGYYSIKSFSELAELGTHIKTEQGNDVYSVAATDGKNGAVLLTHFNDEDETPADTLKLEIKNFPVGTALRAEYYLLDEEHDMKLMREETFTASDFAAYLELPLFTSYLIKFTEVTL